MRYLVTSAEMKRYDENCIQRIGIPGMVLMERAALEAFYVLREKGLAGYGNNGGDGLALARLLAEAGAEVSVWLVGKEEKASGQWREQKRILDAGFSVRFVNWPEDGAYTVVADALFGVGLSGNIAGDAARAIGKANALKGFKLALDLPSGVNADDGRIMGSAFCADLTVTFGFAKRGLFLDPGRSFAGEIRIAEIGISEKSFFGNFPGCFALEEGLERLLPARRRDGNKGTFGKALVIAGSKNMAGAACLCAKACYRAGAGMVKVLSDADNRIILQEILPEALLGALEDEEEWGKSLAWCDVVCVGPGLGRSRAARHALKMVLSSEATETKSLVVDADGLNLIAEDEELKELLAENGRRGRTIVLTPHPGELMRLYESIECPAGESGSAKLTMEDVRRQLGSVGTEIASAFSAIVVAKDARTFICAKDRPLCLNLSGSSALSTAGSGDVLAGIVTAFLCQEGTADPFMSACKAVRVHGLLGERAADGSLLGEHGVMAGDLIAGLGDS